MEITNPILTGFNPDPSLCRQGEDYYIATSTFEWFPGVRIYHSRDLKLVAGQHPVGPRVDAGHEGQPGLRRHLGAVPELRRR